MSKTYLDKTGATYLVSKIWDYVKKKLGKWSATEAIDIGLSNAGNVAGSCMIGWNNALSSTSSTYMMGSGLRASKNQQLLLGHFNSDSERRIVFGTGTTVLKRTTALSINDVGTAWFSGGIYAGTQTETTANKVPTYSDLSSLIRIDESTGDLYITY